VLLSDANAQLINNPTATTTATPATTTTTTTTHTNTATTTTSTPASTTTTTTTTTLALPPLAPYLGPFAFTCRQYPAPDDLAKAHHTRNIYSNLYFNPSVPAADQAMVISAQPPPLPMLVINKATNSAVLLHGITKFYPSIGFQQGTHPATGTTIALMGKAPYPGALPPVVTLPPLAFEDAQMWAAATDTVIDNASPTNPLLQLDNQHTTSMA